jgi:hypothetical protein
LCRDIKELEEELEFIRKHEMRINRNNADAISELNKIT